MLGQIVYWLAVFVISLGLVVGLVLFFESRDRSAVEGSNLSPPARPSARA